MKRLLLLGGVLAFVFGILFFTKDKEEFSSETTLWDLDIQKIEYIPPKESYKPETGETEYCKKPFSIVRKKFGVLDSPVLLVEGKEEEIVYSYESGYNTKNILNDLSGLRAYSVEKIAKENLEKNLLDVNSPKLVLHSNKGKKELIIGKKNKDTYRVLLLDGDKVYSVNSYITDRLKSVPSSLRERQLTPIGAEAVKKLQLKTPNGSLVLENSPKKENSSYQNFWYKRGHENYQIDPLLGNQLETHIRDLRYDLFPDDENGKGFSEANLLVSKPGVIQIDLSATDNSQYRMIFFEPIDLNGKLFYPAQRIVNNKFTESVGYVNQDSVNKILESISTISKAQKYNPPSRRTF